MPQGIIIAHNHTSGDCMLGGADIELTKRICEAGELLGIPIEGHVIIGDGFFSFRREGIIEDIEF